MTNFIPIFPLGIVVYPGEDLNLHIFEERYKQLITECHREGKPFGIPTVINGQIMDYGSIVKVVEIVKVYEDGKMDIRTQGTSIFRVLELIKQIPDKLFFGAIVTYPENNHNGNSKLMTRILDSIRELHQLLHITKHFKKPDKELSAYDVAHHAGLNLEEEFELLQLMREDQRQKYLSRHLTKVLPIINNMDALKEKIKLNGHFRDLQSFNL